MELEETWLGVGAKVGGQYGFYGRESTTGKIFNLGNASYNHWFQITSHRGGIGLGGGSDVSVICVFKSRALYWLDNQPISDWGLNIAIAEKWGDVAKLLSPKYIKLLKFMVKNYEILHHLDDMRDFASLIYNSFDLSQSNSQHPILTFEVPMAGIGLELSLFKSKGRISIYDKGRLGGPLKRRTAP
jgi:hypothetical protein